ncbi:MAG: M55 family metallopeptidase [Spirochaetaceae bacterium]|nr:M55 family metallopeptidase [Spirochaetaceae bacterium]
MKKLYISADIEGVCGIVDWAETEIAEAQGAYFRAQMTREVQAACEAAAAAGVEEIFVKDAHGSGRSIDPSALPRNARLMRAWTRDPFSMMAGIDPGYGAAMLIGYHSGAGSDGNPLAHTMNTDNVRLLVNGLEASEFLLNAYTAASFGVPVVLVSGDRKLCEHAASIDPRIATVAVSEGFGNASVSINPALAVERIKDAAAAVLRAGAFAPFALPKRFDVTIEFRHHFRAYRGSFYPGAVRSSTLAVSYSCSEWMDALKFLFFVL